MYAGVGSRARILGPVTVVSLLSYKVAYGFYLAAEKHLSLFPALPVELSMKC